MDCSVGAWKMRMAEEMQVMEAWFITTVKAILYFQWRISVLVMWG